MTPAFKILFATDIVHDYFSNGVCTHFRLAPSAETTALMTNCNAMYKTVGNKLLVLIKADENNKPLKAPGVSDRFVFFMELMQPVFMNISAPDFGQEGIRRFYFTNLHQNKFSFSAGKDVLYLSKTLETYDSTKAYTKGVMVIHNDATHECVVNAAKNESPDAAAAKWVKRSKHPSATLQFLIYNKEREYEKDEIVFEEAIIYKCLKHTPVNKRPSVSAEFWQPFTNNQFASNDDLLRITPKQFSYTLATEAKQIKVEVLALKTANNKFENLVFSEVQNFEKPVKEVAVDLSKLNDGKYKLIINDSGELIYISNVATYNNYFGVIELFNHLPEGNSFSFYKTSGVLKDEKVNGKNVWLNYTIRFANRLAFVKYIVPQRGVLEILSDASADVFEATGDPPQSFKSKQRLPLQERSNDFKLKLKNKITPDPTFPAPNPDINTPGMITKDDTDYYCNIYLNY